MSDVAAPAVRTRSRTAPAKAQEAVAETSKVVSELQGVMNAFQKVHGSNAFRPASQMQQFMHVPSGIFVLDLALLGGLPLSLQSMIYGWESGGKSTLMSRFIGQCQRLMPQHTVAMIEPEGTYDPIWSAKQGVDPSKLLIGQPDTGEQAVDLACAALEARETAMLCLDSLAALMPAKEFAKSAEDEIVAMQAKLIGRFVRKAMTILVQERKRDHYPALLMINQWRNKIQLMGDPRTLPGGNALKFFVGLRFEVMNKEELGVDARGTEVVDFNTHTIKVTKNKTGNSVRQGEFRLIRNPNHPRGVGFIDEAQTVVTFARNFGKVTGGGSSWRLRDYDGKFGALKEIGEYLYNNPTEMHRLKHEILCEHRISAGLSGTGWLAHD